MIRFGRVLALALAAYLLLPVVFLVVYITVFRAPASAVVPHLYVVLSVLAVTTAFKLALSIVAIGPRVCRALNALVAVGTTLTMVTFYALVFVGLKYWGRVPTVDLARTYLFQARDLLRALGYQPLTAVLAFLAVLLGGWLVAYAFQAHADWSRQLSAVVSRPVRTIASLGLFCVAAIALMTFPDRDWGARAEPLSLSIYPERATVVMQNHAIDIFRSAKIDHEEDAARTSYQPSTKKKLSNVVLIVVDALRADHLSLLGYSRQTTPNLEQRAKGGAMRLSTSAVSVCSESSCGLRAIASSKYLDRQAKRPITLHEVLKRHGYRVNLLLSGDHTNFYGLRNIYGPVDSYFDAVHQSARYINDDRLITDQLQKMAASDGTPTMFQFHLMSAHALGQRYDETPSYGPSENYTAFLAGSSNAQLRERSTNFYDRGVFQADQMIEQILRRLDEQGFLHDAIVIITGDHGESLGERGRYSHTHSVWEEALRVPLLMFTYGMTNAERLSADRIISQVDIAPTILRALSLPIPTTWQGTPVQTADRPRLLYFQQTQFIGLLDGRHGVNVYKHWHDLAVGKEFTFDLLADPAEVQNISEKISPTLRQQWRALLLDRSAAVAPSLEGATGQLKQ